MWREVYDRMPWRRGRAANTGDILTAGDPPPGFPWETPVAGGGTNGGTNREMNLSRGPAPPQLITPEPRTRQPNTSGAEYGVSGTENFGGYIRKEDYNPDLDNWQQAVTIYDKMRRGDAQIRSMLQVLKLPLRGATWAALPPLATGGDPVDQAIADFVNENLFAEGGTLEDGWDATLRHILLQLEFGFAVMELVWDVDDSGYYRLRRLAPRLPKTIIMWHVDRNGKLLAATQWAPVPISTERTTGNGQRTSSSQYAVPVGSASRSPIPLRYLTTTTYKEITIPGEVLAVFTLDREGDNYEGMSCLRNVYRNWFYKDQAYHLEGVRLDRWGVGIPVARLSEGHSLTQSDLNNLIDVLKKVRANERAFLIAPPFVEYDLLPRAASSTAGSGAMEWINHHDAQIARNVLAGFLTMGTDPHGTLGFGSRLTDMFVSSLNGIAAGIANDLNHQVVRRLCFTSDARVTMANGSRKPISEVVIGDRVLSHDGRAHDVTSVMMRPYEGPLALLKATGHEVIRCTPEHPFLVGARRPLFMQRRRYADTMAVESGSRYPYDAGRRRGAVTETAIWREAAAIDRGQYLLSPVMTHTPVEGPSVALCRVLGYFLAEGCFIKEKPGHRACAPVGLQFTFGVADDRRGFVADLCAALEALGATPSVTTPRPSTIVVRVYRCDFVDTVKEYCGEYSDGKHLPADIWSWPIECQRGLLAGYWNGDGCMWESDRGHRVGFAVTRSRVLAEMLIVLLESLRISCRFRARPPRGRSKEAFDVIVTGEAAGALKRFIGGEPPPNDGRVLHQKTFCGGDHHHYRVTEVRQEHYAGLVYNLEVDETHTYLVNGLIAHNCDLNFDMVKRKYPRITCRDLEQIDMKNLIESLAVLAQTWIQPDDDTEKLLRKMLQLPPLPHEMSRKAKQEAAPGTAAEAAAQPGQPGQPGAPGQPAPSGAAAVAAVQQGGSPIGENPNLRADLRIEKADQFRDLTERLDPLDERLDQMRPGPGPE
jgi:hypothetical protein